MVKRLGDQLRLRYLTSPRSCANVLSEVLAVRAELVGDEIGWRSLEDDQPAVVAGAGPQINNPVGVRHDRLMMLDDDYRHTGVDQPVKQPEQLLDVGEVQACGRFVRM